MPSVETFETPSLGDRTYLVTDGDEAVVIDPQRDVERFLEAAARHGAHITHVLETHVHNDYVTGGLELARRTGARYHLNADDEVAFDHDPVRDGDVIEVGDLAIRVLHTPGHTPTHLSYALSVDGDEVAVFTGGSLLYGSVGRTDLVSADLTEELTRAQFRSARRLAEELGERTAVHPTHGFGSFCSSGETSGDDSSTIGQELRDNQALTTSDEDTFVRDLMAGLDAYPAYYAHMAPINRAGHEPVDLSPVERVDTTELARRIHAGEWVVDLRNRTAFAEDHLRGTLNFPFDDSVSTYLGWLIDWGTPVTLIADTADEVAQVQRQLARIGIDRPAGAIDDGLAGIGDALPRGSYRVAGYAELEDAIADGDDPWVLDVRMDGEWADGHLPDATHIPLHELTSRLDEVPDDRQVWVHCASGYRSSVAASLLERAGRTPVLIDDLFDEQAPTRFELVVPAAA